MAADLHAHLTMADLLAGWPSARAVVARRGMACVGCAMAPNEQRSSLASCLYCGRAGERAGEESEPFAGLPTAPID